MKCFLWKFFVRFFGFHSVLAVKITENGLKISFSQVALNIVISTVVNLHIAFVILTGSTENYFRDSSIHVPVTSLLFTRVLRFFQSLVVFSYFISISIMLQQKKYVNIGSKIIKLVESTDVNINSEGFKNIERKCKSLWLIHQILILSGLFINNYNVAKLDFLSFFIVTLFTWNLYILSYLLMLHVLVLHVISVILLKINDDMGCAGRSYLETILKMENVKLLIKNINRKFSWELSIGYIVVVAEILCRVSRK